MAITQAFLNKAKKFYPNDRILHTAIENQDTHTIGYRLSKLADNLDTIAYNKPLETGTDLTAKERSAKLAEHEQAAKKAKALYKEFHELEATPA